MNIKNKIKDCLKEGEKGERHKGLRKTEISEENVSGHIKKAMHNFNAMDFSINLVFLIGVLQLLFIVFIIAFLH